MRQNTYAVFLTLLPSLSVLITGIVGLLAWQHSKKRDAYQQLLESRRPFVELRQKLYMDVLRAASVLATPELHSADEIAIARKRFWELYWGELSLVESQDVEQGMIRLAKALEPELTMTKPQEMTYELAHVLRDSLKATWGIYD